jgi:hypothetical protein
MGRPFTVSDRRPGGDNWGWLDLNGPVTTVTAESRAPSVNLNFWPRSNPARGQARRDLRPCYNGFLAMSLIIYMTVYEVYAVPHKQGYKLPT